MQDALLPATALISLGFFVSPCPILCHPVPPKSALEGHMSTLTTWPATFPKIAATQASII